MAGSKKLPPFQFDTGAWLKDAGLRSVSVAARGLWIDMLAIMHQAPSRGYLLHNTNKPVTPSQLGRMTGCSTAEVSRLLGELEASGVFSRDESGTIYNRRMVRDQRKRELCAKAGRKGGGNPRLATRGDPNTFKGPEGGSEHSLTFRPTFGPTFKGGAQHQTESTTYDDSKPVGGEGGGLPGSSRDLGGEEILQQSQQSPDEGQAAQDPPKISGLQYRAENESLPEGLDTPEFREKWGEWIRFRRSERWSTKAAWARKQLALLSGYGPQIAMATLEQSMRNGWQGVFPDKVSTNGKHAGRQNRRTATYQPPTW